MVGEDDGASTGLDGGGLELVGRDDTLLLVDLGEGLGEVIVTNGANVGDRLGGEDVLCVSECVVIREAMALRSRMATTCASPHVMVSPPRYLYSAQDTHRSGTSGVLGSTASNVGDLRVGDNVLVAVWSVTCRAWIAGNQEGTVDELY